jgi:sortase A
MVRRNMLSTLSGFERLLLSFGMLLILLFTSVQVCSALYSHAGLREFWRNQVTFSVHASADPSQLNSAIPAFRLWSAKRIEAYQASPLSNFPPTLAVLQIPSIGLEVPVLEGTDDMTLNRRVGHIDGTPAPGQDSNVGIAGHRDGFFWGPKDAHLGDYFDLYTKRGNTRYFVDEIRVVLPKDVSVLGPSPQPSITLVTCYPFYFVGSAPLRYIVRASTTSLINIKGSEHPVPSEEGGG